MIWSAGTNVRRTPPQFDVRGVADAKPRRVSIDVGHGDRVLDAPAAADEQAAALSRPLRRACATSRFRGTPA